MSTPTNQQAGKKKEPVSKPGQTTPTGKATPKNTSNAPKPAQTTPRPTQSAAKTPQAASKAAGQSTPKAGTPAAPRAATPPAPKPRDPSVARRDERREERRLEIQARQQERRQELRQARRQKLLIRYDLIIVPVLLVVLVPLFLVLHLPIEALISGLIILFGGFTVLAYAVVGMPTAGNRPARSRSSALPEADVVDSTLDQDAQPTTTPPDTEAENKPAQEKP